MKIFSFIFSLLIFLALGFLFIKIIKILLPFLLFLFIVLVISSLLKSKPTPPKPYAKQKEVIKDVEIRVVDEPTTEELKSLKKENS